MNVIDWLLKGDESICFLVKKNMLNQKTTQNNQGILIFSYRNIIEELTCGEKGYMVLNGHQLLIHY